MRVNIFKIYLLSCFYLAFITTYLIYLIFSPEVYPHKHLFYHLEHLLQKDKLAFEIIFHWCFYLDFIIIHFIFLLEVYTHKRLFTKISPYLNKGRTCQKLSFYWCLILLLFTIYLVFFIQGVHPQTSFSSFGTSTTEGQISL